MKIFTTLKSQTIPLPLSSIDTDMIIPAQYMTSTSRGGYGKNLFRRLRDSDPQFPLNLEKYKNAQIIVAGDNFGCGSSREHAVWALMEHGIRAIIAPSFADIFFNNSAKNGLVLITLAKKTINAIHKLFRRRRIRPGRTTLNSKPLTLNINLEKQTVTLPDKTEHHFFFDPYRKDCILKGHEDLDYLLEHQKEIANWHSKQSK